MCRKFPCRWLAALLVLSSMAELADAQSDASWRRIGTTSVDLGLASFSTGPVDRVWYSQDGSRLYARTHAGRTFETDDFEDWHPSPAGLNPPAPQSIPAASLPEPSARALSAAGGAKLYSLGAAAYRSEDGGLTWSNLTRFRGASLLGAGLNDLATSPREADELTVAAATGVWRSVDGGLSWTGLNQGLPNLPVKRIFDLPNGAHGLRVSLAMPGDPEAEWAPGDKSAWRALQNSNVSRENALKATLTATLGSSITAANEAGGFVYAGSADGQLWTSADKGATWTPASDRSGAPVESIFVSPKDPRIALAALGTARPGIKSPHVLRTMNGGLFWDDMTANLPDSPAHGIAADVTSGAVYLATGTGVFLTTTDLASAGSPTAWTLISSTLPPATATDVKLDAGGNQIFVALDGPGVYAAIAPHRVRDIRVVNAADYSARPAAPGGLLSVIGARVQSAQSATSPVPVLAATDLASQIQVPFDAKGPALQLSLEAASGRFTLSLPLQSASPAIFVDPDGSPLVLDAESGVLLDSAKPARASSHIQILATGLGRVTPDWPAGVAPPVADAPRVQRPVRVILDGAPLQVTKAVLAGYIGYYLIEAELPAIVNAGPAELYVEADGQASNHVRLHLAQ